jgi:hypothetical protein
VFMIVVVFVSHSAGGGAEFVLRGVGIIIMMLCLRKQPCRWKRQQDQQRDLIHMIFPPDINNTVANPESHKKLALGTMKNFQPGTFLVPPRSKVPD